MSLFSIFHQLIIGPLELLFEMIFSQTFLIFLDPGLSIILLSLIINLLVYPLYKRADDLQSAQRNLEIKLNPWAAHIKKAFSGDERYMILQAYYRQNHYKPVYVLRGSVSLLLEIPFFMAAYNMLSSQVLLQGAGFGAIPDLGAPDGMISFFGITVNLLPILMTAINLFNSSLFTKGMPFKSKVQLYGMAFLFLILLYDSPSGLVFYWTLNNVFSLCKTLIGQSKRSRMLISMLSSAAGSLGLIIQIFLYPMLTVKGRLFYTILMLCLQLPLLSHILSSRMHQKISLRVTKEDHIIFLSSCLFAAVLTGILIPSSVIKSSPEEFIKMTMLNNPISYILSSALLSTGTFLIWFGVFYKLVSPAGKCLMSYGILALDAIFLIDYMFFGANLGLLNPDLRYEVTPVFSLKSAVINVLILFLASCLLFFLWKNKKSHVKVACSIACTAIILMSSLNMLSIQCSLGPRLKYLQAQNKKIFSIPISQKGKNVVILMMDRAISSYIPYMLSEKPQLQEQFQGFTYYPNTISFGAHTNFGVPALFGGYEYTPEEMNKREQEYLAEKHNEALKVMPVMFLNNGFRVSVGNPSYAGYQWIPDLGIYDDYPEIQAAMPPITEVDEALFTDQISDLQLRRNFFCFSLFKIAPVFLQPDLYLNGLYGDLSVLFSSGTDKTATFYQNCTDNYNATGLLASFMNSYYILENLPQLTEISDSSQGCFSMMCNEATHAPMMLQVPEYVPAPHVNNTEYEAAHADRFILNGRKMNMDKEIQIKHYHVNMASMIQIGNWLDFLRENDVYDNTKIIIVSDHGSALAQFDDMIFGREDDRDIMSFNPVLLVKDFGSTKFTIDDRFMTQSDVPALAAQGLIHEPKNPFTGKPISSIQKQGEQHILISHEWDVSINNGKTFLPGYWYSVEDNVLDPNNWRFLPDHPLSLTK